MPSLWLKVVSLLSSCLPCLIPIACRPLPNVCTALKPAVCGKHTGTRKALARASRKTRKFNSPPTLFYTNRKQLCENNLILNNTHGSVSPCISSCCFLLLSLLFPSQQYSALNSHLSHPQGLSPKIVLIFTQYSSFTPTNQPSSTYLHKPFRTSTAPSKTQPCSASCSSFHRFFVSGVSPFSCLRHVTKPARVK